MSAFYAFIRWISVMVVLSVAYLFLTDVIGWLFDEHDGTYVRRVAGVLAVGVFISRLADKIAEGRL